MKSLADYMKSHKTSEKRRGATRKGNEFEEEIAALLRAGGWAVDVTKISRSFRRWKGGSGWVVNKADFFTSIDIIALRPEKSPVLLIQATTARGGVAAKRRKIDQTIGGWAEGRELLVITRAADEKSFEVHRRVCSGWAPPFVCNNIDINQIIG